MEKLKMNNKLKKVAIFLGIFVLGVALGAGGEKLLTKKEGKGLASIFRKIINTEPRSGVAPGKQVNQRIEGVVSVSLNPCDTEKLKQPDRTDWYDRSGETISIEGAARRQQKLQEKYDQTINGENMGIFRTRRGCLPCQINKDY